MRLFPIVISCMFVAGGFANAQAPPAPGRSQVETRCGWFDNPTPANVTLYDREAEWIIGVQGGYQVEGEWDWPSFKRGQWVRTNVGSYGYGCACLKMRVDRETSHVLEIKSMRPQPLSVCRQDRTLKKKWGRMFR
jgi:hypothetical protein